MDDQQWRDRLDEIKRELKDHGYQAVKLAHARTLGSCAGYLAAGCAMVFGSGAAWDSWPEGLATGLLVIAIWFALSTWRHDRKHKRAPKEK